MNFWGITGTNGKTTCTWIFAEFVNAPPAKTVSPVRRWWIAWLDTSITQSVSPFASIRAKISFSCLSGGVV